MGRATSQRLEDRPSVYTGHDLVVNFRTRRVFVQGKRVRLSHRQYRLLTKLVENAGRTVSHEQLLECIGEDNSKAGRLRMRLSIRRLREKVETDPDLPDLITTQWGEGYRFEERNAT